MIVCLWGSLWLTALAAPAPVAQKSLEQPALDPLPRGVSATKFSDVKNVAEHSALILGQAKETGSHRIASISKEYVLDFTVSSGRFTILHVKPSACGTNASITPFMSGHYSDFFNKNIQAADLELFTTGVGTFAWLHRPSGRLKQVVCKLGETLSRSSFKELATGCCNTRTDAQTSLIGNRSLAFIPQSTPLLLDVDTSDASYRVWWYDGDIVGFTDPLHTADTPLQSGTWAFISGQILGLNENHVIAYDARNGNYQIIELTWEKKPMTKKALLFKMVAAGTLPPHQRVLALSSDSLMVHSVRNAQIHTLAVSSNATLKACTSQSLDRILGPPGTWLEVGGFCPPVGPLMKQPLPPPPPPEEPCKQLVVPPKPGEPPPPECPGAQKRRTGWDIQHGPSQAEVMSLKLTPTQVQELKQAKRDPVELMDEKPRKLDENGEEEEEEEQTEQERPAAKRGQSFSSYQDMPKTKCTHKGNFLLCWKEEVKRAKKAQLVDVVEDATNSTNTTNTSIATTLPPIMSVPPPPEGADLDKPYYINCTTPTPTPMPMPEPIAPAITVPPKEVVEAVSCVKKSGFQLCFRKPPKRKAKAALPSPSPAPHPKPSNPPRSTAPQPTQAQPPQLQRKSKPVTLHQAAKGDRAVMVDNLLDVVADAAVIMCPGCPTEETNQVVAVRPPVTSEGTNPNHEGDTDLIGNPDLSHPDPFTPPHQVAVAATLVAVAAPGVGVAAAAVSHLVQGTNTIEIPPSTLFMAQPLRFNHKAGETLASVPSFDSLILPTTTPTPVSSKGAR